MRNQARDNQHNDVNSNGKSRFVLDKVLYVVQIIHVNRMPGNLSVFNHKPDNGDKRSVRLNVVRGVS